MSPIVVLQQMFVIFALMMVGMIAGRKGKLTEETSRNISWLVVNICGPAMVMNSVLNGTSATKESVLLVGGIVLIIYAVLILLSYVMPILLQADSDDRVIYQMMTIFGNIGFIGYPVITALLGADALIYAAVFNLVFNVLMYTYGSFIMRRAAGKNKSQGGNSILNAGTVSCVLAIVIFWFEIPMPSPVCSFVAYMGDAAVFLSLIVIGESLVHIKVKEIFEDRRMLLFVALRYILFPIAAAFILKFLVADPQIRGVSVLLVAMPAATFITMFAKQYEMEETTIVKGTVLTTLLSVVTVAIVGVFI